MRAGTVELPIPKLRKGSYFPGFLASDGRSARCRGCGRPTSRGVCARWLDDLAQAMGMGPFPASRT